MIDLREYRDARGRSPFREWFESLDSEAARRVTIALYRIGLGNFSSVKGVGGGVLECRISFGPGYRIYFGKEGETAVILLGGGTKKRQESDIQAAHQRWLDYKQMRKLRKSNEE